MNFPAKPAFIGLSIFVLVACSAQEGGASKTANDQMSKHNPQMHQQISGDANGHQPGIDERIAVHLSAGERQHVLMEMRGLLEATQNIVEGLATDNMEQVQNAARAAGTAGRKTTENQIMHKKMPKEWMRIGMMAHTSMDEIAVMASEGKPAREIQLKLADTMKACIACHATFRLPNP